MSKVDEVMDVVLAHHDIPDDRQDAIRAELEQVLEEQSAPVGHCCK